MDGEQQQPDPDALAGSLGDELSSTLEREVNEILRAAEAEAARIKKEAAHQATEIQQQQSERLNRLLERLDRLADAIGDMLDGMRTELQAAIAERPIERPAQQEAPARQPEPITEPPPPVQEKEPAPPAPPPLVPVPETAPATPSAPVDAGKAPAPDPELEKIIRKQITTMLEEGKSRSEAAEFLSRFNMGKSYLGMIDEIYWGTDRKPKGIAGRLRHRRRAE